MTFYKLNGFKVNKNIEKYRINWLSKSRSKFQSQFKFQIEPFWRGHVVYEEFPVVGTRMSLDFVNLTMRVAVEVQGEQHQKMTKFFHKNYIEYADQVERDVKKQEWCNINRLDYVEVFPSNMPITETFLRENKLII